MEPSGNREVSGDKASQAIRTSPETNSFGVDPVASVAVSPTTDANPLGLKDLPFPAAPNPWHWIGGGTIVVLAISIVAAILVMTAARDKEQTLLQAEERRLQESVHSRVNLLRTWLDAQQMASRRLSKSQVFRLFVTDLAAQEAPAPLPRPLQDQRPYFRQLLGDFVEQNGLMRATVLREDGSVLLSTPGPTLTVSTLLAQLESAAPGWTILPLPIRALDDGEWSFAIDIVIPLSPIQSQTGTAEKSSTFLVLTSPIDVIAADLLSDAEAEIDGETVALLQWRDNSIQQFDFSTGILDQRADVSLLEARPGTPIKFSRFDADGSLFATAAPLPGTPWAIYHAVDAEKTLASVQTFIMAAIGLSAISVFALATTLLGSWWRQGRNHHLEIVQLYKAQAQNVDRQRRFLQATTRSIGDWLTVSSSDGRLIYANAAFVAACAAPEQMVLGRKWQDLIAEPREVKYSQGCLTDLIDESPFTQMVIGDQQRIVSTRSFDLKAEDETSAGTVRVIRDHTLIASERQRRLQAMTQTIDAFVHAVELRDAFLVGHTHRLRNHAIAMGQRLELSSDSLAGLALAASLSQIGKIFIPDAILAKPIRHNDEEADIMRGHINHAIGILKRIDFDMPIIDILGQMHERLDGSGYPHGFVGDEISLPARILGVADVFCARTAPRSYRDRMSAKKALYHLASNEHRYDEKVVRALSAIIEDNPEDLETTAIAQNFIDDGIWQERIPAGIDASASVH